jgi:hypothetical protein
MTGVLSQPDRLGPGSHVCCVVDSAPQFEAWSAACLTEGAETGEKLFHFAPQDRLASLSLDPSVTRVDPGVAFLAGGPLEPTVMYAMFRRETAAARLEGYRGLRLIGDMDWLFTRRPSRAEVAAYELLLDEVVRELGITVVCAYRTAHFDATAITELVAVHPLTVGAVPVEPGFRMWNVARGVWEVTGEVDEFNAEPFGRALQTAAGDAAIPRLRASGLRFIGVAGIQAIVHAVHSRPDQRLAIENATSIFQRCWSLLDLDRHLPGVAFEPGVALAPSVTSEPVRGTEHQPRTQHHPDGGAG